MSIGIFVFNLIFSVIIIPKNVSAISTDDIESIINDTPYYDPNETECSVETEAGGELVDAGGYGEIYKSGLSSPYILEQFMIHILKRLAQIYNKPESELVTQEHVIALLAFAQGEGGDIQNSSIFNPMNTSYRDADIQPVAYAAGGRDGRQAYKSFDIGVEAYARHFSRDDQYQNRLGSVLSKKDSTAKEFMEALTYFDRYKGNKTWATAALSNPDEYYKERLDLIETVRNRYAKIAGLQIGTRALEQKSGIYKTDLIFYKDLVKQGDEENTDTSNLNTDACDDAQDLPKNGSKTFTTNTSITFPGVEDAVRRAKAIATMKGAAFKTACDGNPNCFQRCDGLAAEIWGYSTSGYYSAKVHASAVEAAGKLNKKDRNPPIGALLFYNNSGPYGHIAVYLGDGLLVSNDVNDKTSGVKGGVYIVPTDALESGPWSLGYIGWSEPIFAGAKRTSNPI